MRSTVVILLALGYVYVQSPPSRNVSTCSGYELGSIAESEIGFTAQLALRGPSCDSFGTDILNLTIEVTYETESRLHVNIHDSDNKQFVIPESVIARPSPPSQATTNDSDLVFNYDASPFAFWITRRSDPTAPPLFDTRISSLPATPVPPVIANDTRTALDGFQLVFEDQYLQLTTSLPLDANIYGLGEYYSLDGFRRRISEEGGSVQTMWARNIADPIDQNMYGSHPFYLDHRYNEATGEASSHGVFLFNAAGGDILLLTPPNNSLNSILQYRMIGGTFDLYFFSGPTPQAVVEQYGEMIGFPTWQPAWGFGFQLCRWGYNDVNETKQQVVKMREAGIPLEVMWNDIDMYLSLRDFTTDPARFPIEDVKAFIQELAANDQKYIPIVDAAIAKTVNETDTYDPYTDGARQDVFVKNADGSEYIGKVWPGYTVFPDWFAENAQTWWTDALRNWSNSGVEFSGIWLDMNEPASFCQGSCGTGEDLNALKIPNVTFPGQPGNLVVSYPECYDSATFGPSGNITVNGSLTCQLPLPPALSKREMDLLDPPYTIHNGNGTLPISWNTTSSNSTHAGNITEYDVHNLFGMMEEKATHLALQEIRPGKRPFLISRSTFPSAGKWTGHWLGDNFSTWKYLYLAIQGVLQFQLFQIPFVGADACGFNGNTDEELCNRWMQMAAFMPFFRNHNERGALSQEPYRWDSVANASRSAIATRYSLLPYWYTLFANSSTRGTPPMRALFFEFPEEPELFGLDRQFMIGRDLLVTPVLTPNVSTVEGIFPGRGQVIWRDFFTHQVVNNGSTVTLQAPLGHIPVHIRDGAAILMYSNPGYTITETRRSSFSLLVSLSSTGDAFGSVYLDDGESIPPTPNTTLNISASGGRVVIVPSGEFMIENTLNEVVILGVGKAPKSVQVGGQEGAAWEYNEVLEELKIMNASLGLNSEQSVIWE